MRKVGGIFLALPRAHMTILKIRKVPGENIAILAKISCIGHLMSFCVGKEKMKGKKPMAFEKWCRASEVLIDFGLGHEINRQTLN